MQEGIDYRQLDGNIVLLRTWKCDKCNLIYSFDSQYSNIYSPHTEGRCLNIQQHTICWKHKYGTHIQLECIKCSSTFSTKNIDYIGARSIFNIKCVSNVCDHKFSHRC